MKENIWGIKVGMVTSFWCWTDRHAAKVVAVTPKTFSIVKLGRGKNRLKWPAQNWEIDVNEVVSAPMIVRKTKYGYSTKNYRVAIPRFIDDPMILGTLAYEDPSF